jgi:hypothetical protein
MAEAQGKTRRSPQTPVGIAGGATIDPFLQASNCLLAGWVAVGNELFEFGKARLDRSLAISKALAESGSLDQAIELQSRYARTVVQDYVAEASKIVDLGTRSLLDSMSELQPAADQATRHAEPLNRTAA